MKMHRFPKLKRIQLSRRKTKKERNALQTRERELCLVVLFYFWVEKLCISRSDAEVDPSSETEGVQHKEATRENKKTPVWLFLRK